MYDWTGDLSWQRRGIFDWRWSSLVCPWGNFLLTLWFQKISQSKGPPIYQKQDRPTNEPCPWVWTNHCQRLQWEARTNDQHVGRWKFQQNALPFQKKHYSGLVFSAHGVSYRWRTMYSAQSSLAKDDRNLPSWHWLWCCIWRSVQLVSWSWYHQGNNETLGLDTD